ncbi:MAG TPA: hypothetical protein DCF63_12015 [Planctomycetaceae bacterium]|nr:hypothetical protein [Planctomycetaceae bacterium]
MMNCRTFGKQCNKMVSLLLGASLLLVSLTGCRKDNPGKWPAERVTAKVAESLQLSEFSLSPATNGLEGSGKRADGETLKVVVTLHPDTSEIRWNAKGDRGFEEEGSYQLQ